MFTSSPFRGRWGLLRWILSCGEKVANFRVTRYLSGPKHTAFCDLPSSLHYAVRPVVFYMAFFLQFTEEQISQNPDIDEDLRTMLLQAGVHSSMPGIFRAQGISNCALFVALADSEAELKASMQVLFGIDRSQGVQHILESAKLITVWKQARVRSDTQRQVEASARAHGLPLELPHGTWGNLLKGFATKFGDTVPKQELPSQSYFEQLEEMLQDGLLYAESLTQVVSLEAELQHMRSASDSSNSHHVAMYFDGTTLKSKRRLSSPPPSDFESFREKYEVITNVWRFLEIKTPGRPVLAGMVHDTWDQHRRWLMDNKTFKLQFEVSPGVWRLPSWELCLAYDFDVRSHACDFIRMKGYSLVAALEAARNDQEHRTHYWVRKLALVGNQSGSSSSSVKGSPAVVKSIHNAFPAQGQSREVKALGSKFDKLAQELRRGRPDAAPKAIMDKPRDRSRTPKVILKKKGKGNSKGQKKGQQTTFADLRAMKSFKGKFMSQHNGTEICWKFQDMKCMDSSCARAHVCAGCGGNTPFSRCGCVSH